MLIENKIHESESDVLKKNHRDTNIMNNPKD